MKKLYKISWRDAVYDTDSVPDYLRSMDCVCETVGFLVAEDNTYVTLARDLFTHSYEGVNKEVTEDFSCFLKIPKAVILSRRMLG